MHIRDYISEDNEVKTGVPQGTFSGPIFVIFITKFSTSQNKSLSKFAKDTKIGAAVTNIRPQKETAVFGYCV